MSSYVSPADQTELSLAQASSVNNLDAATAAAFALLPDETLLDQGRVTHAVDTGAANAYLVALPNTLAAYTDGAHVVMRPLAANTGASTINVDSLGVKSIRTNTGAALSAGDITVGVPCSMRYSTATGYFHLDAGAISSAVAAAASAAAAALSAAAAATAETNAEASEIAAAASAAAFVDATTTVKGKVELATVAECQTGTDTARAVTPEGAKASVLQFATLPKNYITGLTLSNDTDTEHDIAIAVGECRDSADGSDLALAAILTKQIDAAFAAGDDAGGMFTGTVANGTWYHKFLIKKDSDGTVDAGFDTSITAANIPAGYTAYRRLGSVKTDGSANIIAFAQIEDMFYWKDPPLDVNAVATGTALQTKTLSVPPDVNVMVHFNFARATGTGLMYFKTPGVNDEAPSATAAPLGIWVTADNTYLHPPVMTNTSKQITSRASTDQNLYLATLGWQDFRGVNA